MPVRSNPSRGGSSLCEAGRPFLNGDWPRSLVQIGGNTTLASLLRVETTTTTEMFTVSLKLIGSMTTSEKVENRSIKAKHVTVTGDGWRYFTMLDCEEGGQHVCVLFKDHIGHDVAKHAVEKAAILLLTSSDGLRFDSDPTVFMPHAAQVADSTTERLLTHNLAVLTPPSTAMGRHCRRYISPSGYYHGIRYRRSRMPGLSTRQ